MEHGDSDVNGTRGGSVSAWFGVTRFGVTSRLRRVPGRRARHTPGSEKPLRSQTPRSFKFAFK